MTGGREVDGRVSGSGATADPARPDPVPVDTLDPVEPALRHPSTVRTWALTVGGPMLWIVHFGFVYLMAEAACTADRDPTLRFAGPGTMQAIVVVATVVVAVACVGFAVVARRAAATNHVVRQIAVALWLGAAVAVVAVGVPALVLASELC